MEQRKISRAVISRLPRYYRYLGDLLEAGVERISSNDLSKKMKVTASQIRQDLNNFGGFGQQGYGYNVKYLYEEIGKILGLDKKHNMIIVGGGNLGQALANYVDFEKQGFYIRGIFDVNPVLKGLSVRGIQIHMLDDLESFIRDEENGYLIDSPEAAVETLKGLSGNLEFCRALGEKALAGFVSQREDMEDQVLRWLEESGLTE